LGMFAVDDDLALAVELGQTAEFLNDKPMPEVPPKAVFMACMPRSMASTGMVFFRQY
jgi:hypothetical protein